MAHGIMQNDQMLYSGKTPWHGLGISLSANVTALEAFQTCLNWQVADQEIFMSNGTPITTHKAIVRNDTNECLAIMGADYTSIQNELSAQVAHSLVGGEPVCHTAGSLKNGRKIWFLMELGTDQLKDSAYKRYLMVCNTHDGSQRFTVFFTSVRVVCNNTYSAALGDIKGNMHISVRHSKNAIINLKDAVKTMDRANSYFGKFMELARTMQDTPFTEQQMKELAEYLLPGSKPRKKQGAIDPKTALAATLANTQAQNDAMDSLLPSANVGILDSIVESTKRSNGTFNYQKKDEVATVTKRQREKMVELFETGRGNDSVRGSAWAAFNAVTEYTDHTKTYRNTDVSSAAENRMESTLFGESSKLKEKALNRILEQVQL